MCGEHRREQRGVHTSHSPYTGKQVMLPPHSRSHKLSLHLPCLPRAPMCMLHSPGRQTSTQRRRPQLASFHEASCPACVCAARRHLPAPGAVSRWYTAQPPTNQCIVAMQQGAAGAHEAWLAASSRGHTKHPEQGATQPGPRSCRSDRQNRWEAAQHTRTHTNVQFASLLTPVLPSPMLLISTRQPPLLARTSRLGPASSDPLAWQQPVQSWACQRTASTSAAACDAHQPRSQSAIASVAQGVTPQNTTQADFLSSSRFASTPVTHPTSDPPYTRCAPLLS
mmetsp:Transcript_27494/g.69967  ORF Transcript_27494/g.69967 Transcript_27494/m.69967 type:complete len:281 (-) Transcript_27494:1501-2343(-)